MNNLIRTVYKNQPVKFNNILKNKIQEYAFNTIKDKKEEVQKRVFDFRNVNEALANGYEIYHKTFTSVVDEFLQMIRRRGFEVSEEEIWQNISVGNGRPAEGKTTRITLNLMKEGEPSKRKAFAQVYGTSTGYELNAYIQ